MSREQQGVVLFISLALCLFFLFSGPHPFFKDGERGIPGGERFPPTPAGQGFPVEIDGGGAPRGIIQAEAGMTVGQALEKAGGIRGNLSLSPEDLTQKIEKSSRLSVLREGEGKGKVIVEPLAPPKLKVLSVPISLNTATVEELDILPGIGPKTAQAIVEFREKKGKFASPEDLLQVPGIGPKKLAALQPHIKIE